MCIWFTFALDNFESGKSLTISYSDTGVSLQSSNIIPHKTFENAHLNKSYRYFQQNALISLKNEIYHYFIKLLNNIINVIHIMLT